MAGCMAEILIVHLNAAALEVEHSYRISEEIVINAVLYLEGVGVGEAVALDVVSSGILHGREIALPVSFSGRCIAHGAAEVACVNGLVVVSVHDLELCLICNAAENSCFFAAGLISDLIDVYIILSCDRAAVINFAVVDQFKRNIVDENGMSRKGTAVLLLKAAVEHEL